MAVCLFFWGGDLLHPHIKIVRRAGLRGVCGAVSAAGLALGRIGLLALAFSATFFFLLLLFLRFIFADTVNGVRCWGGLMT